MTHTLRYYLPAGPEGHGYRAISDQEWFSGAEYRELFDDWIVAKTSVTPYVEVSTVFLFTDHNWGGNGPPILYETCVFMEDIAPSYEKLEPFEGVQRRYRTWDEAKAGHDEIVRQIEEALHIVNTDQGQQLVIEEQQLLLAAPGEGTGQEAEENPDERDQDQQEDN